jgi:hypothetical protein
MNSLDTFHKRLRDQIAAVEKEIQSHKEQVEALAKRLEGLKRADELFESEQSAIAELLRSSIANGSGSVREMATRPAPAMQRAVATPKAPGAQKHPGRRTQVGRGAMQSGRARTGQDGGLTRVDMIAAVLKRHRGLSVRDLLAALNKEFGWKSSESNVTALLYTNQTKFAHTKPDRVANRLVTWSLK